MWYSKIVMILNISDYGLIKKEIKQLNIPGITVTKVQGFGDYVNEFNNDGFTEGLKIVIYTSSEQAELIAKSLSQLANELTEGGGVVAVEPVSKLYNVILTTNQPATLFSFQCWFYIKKINQFLTLQHDNRSIKYTKRAIAFDKEVSLTSISV